MTKLASNIPVMLVTHRRFTVLLLELTNFWHTTRNLGPYRDVMLNSERRETGHGRRWLLYSYQCHALGTKNCFVASLYPSFIKYRKIPKISPTKPVTEKALR